MIAIIAATALSGCAQQTFKINNGIAEKPTQETRQNFFINGIGQSQTIDASLFAAVQTRLFALKFRSRVWMFSCASSRLASIPLVKPECIVLSDILSRYFQEYLLNLIDG